jgi:DNA invertase Pin-like site-specific DNA recombinase
MIRKRKLTARKKMRDGRSTGGPSMTFKTSRQIYEAFEKEIKRSGKSCRMIARNVGLSSATLHSIKARGGNMQTDTMLALAKELGFKVKVER